MRISPVNQIMNCTGKVRVTVACGLVLLGSTLPMVAQSIWDGGGSDGKWGTAANWQLDTLPVSATTTQIQFAGSAQTTVDADSAVTAQRITFNSGASAFTLNNSAITLQGTGSGYQTVINSSANLQTINNALNITAGGISASAGNMQINGTVAVSGANGFRLAAGPSKVLTINGAITGGITGDAFAVDAAGGTVVLNNTASTWTGGLNVWNGTVIANGNSVSDYATASIFGKNGSVAVGISSGSANAAVLTGGSYVMANAFRINSNASAGVTYTLGGNSASNSTFSGVIKLSSISGTADGMNVTAAAGGRVNFTGGIVKEATATGTGDTVNKVGAGVVALSGTNTYSGVTTVSAGVLLVNGTLSAVTTGTVSVVAGATLGGNGRVLRDVSVADNASLAAGDMDLLGNSLVGTFTVGEAANNASLLLSNASILNFDLATTAASDKIAVAGNLTLDGVLNVSALTGFDVGTYTLFTYTGSLTNNGLDLGTTPGGYTYTVDTGTAGIVNLTVVPEPGSMALLVTSLIGLGAWGHRRKHARERFAA